MMNLKVARALAAMAKAFKASLPMEVAYRLMNLPGVAPASRHPPRHPSRAFGSLNQRKARKARRAIRSHSGRGKRVMAGKLRRAS